MYKIVYGTTSRATTTPILPRGGAHACRAAAALCVVCSHVETVLLGSVQTQRAVSSQSVGAPLGAKLIHVVFLATHPFKLDYFIEE